MAGESKSLEWLPGLLIAAGLFFLVAGFFSDGPEFVGGIVFGGISLAAAGAILYRRSRDASEVRSKEVAELDAAPDREEMS